MKRFGSICMVLMMISALIFIFPTLSFATCSNGIFNNGLHGLTIDINSAPFTTFANYSYGSVAYKKNGCAWYASARVNQLTGKGNTIWSGSSWYNSAGANLGFSKGTTLSTTNRALACYENHVTVVEGIVNGNILISEGSYSYDPYYGSSGGTPYGYCRIEVMSQYNLEHRDSAFIGYVYLPVALITNDTSAPVITSATVGNVTSTGYDVYVSATDNVGVTKIRIGTWHDNMHIDNAVWQETTSLNNGSATIHVSISDFGNAQNVTYHTNVYAYDAAGNYNVNGTRAGDPYINGNLTTVWMTPQTDYIIPVGDSITISFGADQPVDWYKHIVDMNTSEDSGGLVSTSSTGGSTAITFNSPGYYKVFMGAWHVSGDMYTDPIYVTVKESHWLFIKADYKYYSVPAIEVMSTVEAGSIVSLGDYPISLTEEQQVKYEFDHWESEDAVVFSNPYDENTTFTMPHNDTTIIKVFKPRSTGYINLSLIATTGGIITLDTTDGNYEVTKDNPLTVKVFKDDRISLSVFQDDYYEFSGWETTGSWIEDLNSGYLGFIYPPESDTTVRAVFTPGPYAVDETRVFYLPNGLQEIEEEAFAGVTARYFIVPDSVTSIGNNAFPEGSFVYLNVSKILNVSMEAITNRGVFIETGASFDTNFGEALKDSLYQYVNKYGQSGITKKLQYRYRTKQTTTSTQSTMSGWTLYDEQSGAWGAWISNGTTPVTASADVEVNPIYHAEQTGITGYNYHRFRYTNSSGTVKYTYSESYATSHGGYRENNSVTAANRLPLYNVYDGNQSYGVQYNFWFYEEPVTGVISPAYTEYQYRTRTRTYYFYRWSDWSDWQDEPVTENENIEVEIREI